MDNQSSENGEYHIALLGNDDIPSNVIIDKTRDVLHDILVRGFKPVLHILKPRLEECESINPSLLASLIENGSGIDYAAEFFARHYSGKSSIYGVEVIDPSQTITNRTPHEHESHLTAEIDPRRIPRERDHLVLIRSIIQKENKEFLAFPPKGNERDSLDTMDMMIRCLYLDIPVRAYREGAGIFSVYLDQSEAI